MGQKVLIAAGGTGGHIYPAIAIAKALKSKSYEVHFAGTAGRMEQQIIPLNGFELHSLKIGRLNGVSLLEKIKTVLMMPFTLLKAYFIIKKLKPQFVLGVGGAVSGPVLLAASLSGCKTFIWEPNATPGMANRLLSSFVDESLLVFSEAQKKLKTKKTTIVGMPIREEIEAIVAVDGMPKKPLKVLVFGGSQGARAINNTVSEAVAHGGDWAHEVEIIHQTGQADYARIKAIYDQLHSQNKAKNTQCFEYLNDMDKQYAWADLVVSRCGTGTISELAACGMPAVLVPFAAAADNHQQKNAESLVKAEAALMVLQRDFTSTQFIKTIEEAKKHPEHLEELALNIKKFHKPRAAEEIANHMVAATEVK